MKQLLDAGNNALTSVKSRDVITIESILAVSKVEPKALAPSDQEQEGTQVITTRSDALDETDHNNLTNQAVIGTKGVEADCLLYKTLVHVFHTKRVRQ